MILIMIDPKEFLEFLKGRRSIRKFKDELIPDESINMILEAGQWTCSASNKQPWEFIVIKSKDKIQEIKKATRYGKFIGTAPVLIAIVGKINQNPKWYVIDTSLASMNMILMAWSMRIGTCWIGSMDREKAKKALGLGKNDYLLTVLPFGYIKGDIPQPTLRKELKNIVKQL